MTWFKVCRAVLCWDSSSRKSSIGICSFNSQLDLHRLQSQLALSLSFCPTPTTCIRKGITAHVFLTATRTPPHIILITSGALPIWTIGGRGAEAETSRSHQRHKWLHVMDCAMHYNIIDLILNNLQFDFIYRMKQLEIQSDSVMCNLNWGAETSVLLNGVYVESQWSNIEFFLFAALYVFLCWNKILVHNKSTAEQ